MELSKWQVNDWKPKKFKYDWTKKEDFTSASGLSLMVELFSESDLFFEFKKCLPERLSNNSYHTSHFALLLISGFWMGFDCLDDMMEFSKNPVVIAQFGKVPVPKSFGDYLRDFTEENILALRNFLTTQALFYRSALKKDDSITFDIDSTDHEHHGDTIEGLEINYKGKWCLDSLEVFDELGFCYDFSLRPGATFSSQGSEEMMKNILLRRPLDPFKTDFDYSRMDSAFCTEEMIRLCLNKRLKATITAHGRIGWEKEISNISNWVPWEWSEEELQRAITTETPLPRIEVGFYMYQPGFADNIRLPVIIKRTHRAFERISHKKRAEMIRDGKNPREGFWEHYAVLSLMGIHPLSPQQIMQHHQGRANMENLIKEEKISFDLRHFPTKKISSNSAYALFGLIAHNFFRFISILDNPAHPQFAKALRRRFVQIPGKFLIESRQRVIRMSETSYQEVIKLKMRWAEIFKPPPDPFSDQYRKKSYRAL